MSNTPMSVEVQNHAQAVDGKGKWGHGGNHATHCKIAGCTKSMQNSSHGVCRTHYKMLLKMVRSGATTWAILESKGITDPATYTRDPHDRTILEKMLENALK